MLEAFYWKLYVLLCCIADMKRKQTNEQKKIAIQYSRYKLERERERDENPEVPYYLYRDCQSTITKNTRIKAQK